MTRFSKLSRSIMRLGSQFTISGTRLSNLFLISGWMLWVFYICFFNWIYFVKFVSVIVNFLIFFVFIFVIVCSFWAILPSVNFWTRKIKKYVFFILLATEIYIYVKFSMLLHLVCLYDSGNYSVCYVEVLLKVVFESKYISFIGFGRVLLYY